ncbi:MAG: hypothetical protein LCH63_13740 [Candidatus Melainabacteria bacterium]|jgi:hypothetical protein|nr:hypothetical protein [Candidatus Melainabacteria bacterium]
MSLGLYLKGRFSGKGVNSEKVSAVFDRATLEEFERWISNVAFDELEWSQWTEDDDGNPCLMLLLHPGAEPIMLSPLSEDELLVAAATSSAGPGYHIFICDLLRKLAQCFGLDWYSEEEAEALDETGFFETGDKERLYEEFNRWMGALSKRVSELSREGAKFHLAMPFDGHQFDVSEPILTQLGPRDMHWLQAVTREPSLGRDIFPWWEDGHGAEYHLGRALCYMWNAMRWREPLTESEAELNETVLRHLDSAYNLDPDLEFPWREWAQIIAYSGSDCEMSAFIEEKADQSDFREARLSLVGYRRYDVRKNLGGGWSIAIPGTFVEELEEGQTFLAYDETRNVRVTCMSATDAAGQPLDAEEILRKIKVIDDPVRYERNGIFGRAFFEKITEEDAEFWMLRGVASAEGTFAQVTICFEEEDDQTWALSIIRSLDHRVSHQR